MEDLKDTQPPIAPQTATLQTDPQEQPISPELLTIILTTSPIPSSPLPDMLKNTLDSLPPALKNIPIVITFDGFKVFPDDKERLKKGRITQALADTYPEYIGNIKNLFPNRSTGPETETDNYHESHADNVVFLRLKKRMGFAFSVRVGLNFVKTPFVMILQHDWLFTLPYPPLNKIMSILQKEPDDVQYIGFVARMSIDYVHSRSFFTNFKHCFKEGAELRKDRVLGDTLVPCMHWFDRPHFANVETYRKIFNLGLLKKGDFIEDTFGTKYLSSISTAGSLEEAYAAWKKYGAWMYYPDNGSKAAVRHGSGRLDKLGERQEEWVRNYIKECQANSERYQNRDKWTPGQRDDDLSGLHREEEESMDHVNSEKVEKN